MTTSTTTHLWKAYLGNLGRPPQDGEQDEFTRAFADKDVVVLRRAIDKLFAGRRDFVRIADLRQCYAQEHEAEVERRRSHTPDNQCRTCGGTGMLPEITHRNGEPILRYGLACPSCEAGGRVAISAKLTRPGFESLPHVEHAQAVSCSDRSGWYPDWIHTKHREDLDGQRPQRQVPDPLAESIARLLAKTLEAMP